MEKEKVILTQQKRQLEIAGIMEAVSMFLSGDRQRDIGFVSDEAHSYFYNGFQRGEEVLREVLNKD